MNKLNIAIACSLGTLCVANVASASEVTIYGRIDTALQYLDGGGNLPEKGSSTALTEAGQAGSRFGLRGKERLSDDLAVVFTLENGFSSVTGSSGDQNRFFNRQSFVGLSHKQFGNLTFGRHYNATFDLVGTFTGFGNSFGLASQNVAFSNVFVRSDNSIKYQLPANLFGLRGSIVYSNRAGMEGIADDSRALSVAATYNYGSITALVGYDRLRVNRGLGGGSGGTIASYIGGLQWKSGTGLEVAAMYGEDHNGRISAGSTGINEFGGVIPVPNAFYSDKFKAKTWLVGVKYNVAGGTLMASHSSSSPSGLANLKRQKISAVGYRYDLSKRTNVYGTFAYAQDGNYLAGADVRQARLGIAHVF